mgnify:CR=1 FL=1
MNYSNILADLFNLQRRGIKLGLEHTINLLDEINNPQNNFKCIHVAGTNGKGTTSALIQKILCLSGKKVGLYTSPHLIRFNERIRVNGKSISDYHVIKFFKNVHKKIQQIQSTFFEVCTAMAFDYFNKQNVDVAVIETGLGGRLDSTNVINPELSVITPISYDHQNILGEKLETIAYEKAGIIKNCIPVIIGRQEKVVEDVITKKAKDVNSKLYKVNYKLLTKVKPNLRGTYFCYDGRKYFIPLIGRHQVENSMLAIEAVKIFDNSIDIDHFMQGVKTVIWPGRMQRLKKNIYFDVSHNHKGIEVTISTLKKNFPDKKVVALFCLKKDKNIKRIIDSKINYFNRIYVSSDNNNLLMSTNKLHNAFFEKGIECISTKSIKNGVKNLKKDVKNGYIGIIIGSHYIAKEVFSSLEISCDTEII